MSLAVQDFSKSTQCAAHLCEVGCDGCGVGQNDRADQHSITQHPLHGCIPAAHMADIVTVTVTWFSWGLVWLMGHLGHDMHLGTGDEHVTIMWCHRTN